MNETSRTRAAPTRSDSQPPSGSADDGEQREAGGARAGVGLGEVVHAGEQLGQVEEHGDEAAEGEEVEERERPRAAAGAEHREGGEHAGRRTGPWRPRRVAREHEEDAAHRDHRPVATQNGAASPQWSTIRGAVRPASTVPPIPMP